MSARGGDTVGIVSGSFVPCVRGSKCEEKQKYGCGKMVSLPRVHDTSFARVGSHLPVYSTTWLRSRFLVLVAGDSTLPVINARAKPWERRSDWFCFPGIRISGHGRVSNVGSYGRHLYRFSIVRGEPCICLTCL